MLQVQEMICKSVPKPQEVKKVNFPASKFLTTNSQILAVTCGGGLFGFWICDLDEQQLLDFLPRFWMLPIFEIVHTLTRVGGCSLRRFEIPHNS